MTTQGLTQYCRLIDKAGGRDLEWIIECVDCSLVNSSVVLSVHMNLILLDLVEHRACYTLSEKETVAIDFDYLLM